MCVCMGVSEPSLGQGDGSWLAQSPMLTTAVVPRITLGQHNALNSQLSKTQNRLLSL